MRARAAARAAFIPLLTVTCVAVAWSSHYVLRAQTPAAQSTVASNEAPAGDAAQADAPAATRLTGVTVGQQRRRRHGDAARQRPPRLQRDLGSGSSAGAAGHRFPGRASRCRRLHAGSGCRAPRPRRAEQRRTGRHPRRARPRADRQPPAASVERRPRSGDHARERRAVGDDRERGSFGGRAGRSAGRAG